MTLSPLNFEACFPEDDVDAFFQLTTGSNYREKLRLSADRFVAALVRVFEKMASARRIQQAHACNTLINEGTEGGAAKATA